MLGKTDISLNKRGLIEVKAAARRLKTINFDIIVSSNLRRALETAAVVNKNTNRRIVHDSRLQERSFGSFEGLVTAEVMASMRLKRGQSISSILPPDAEQWSQTIKRSRRAIAIWLQKYPDKTILFVGHAAFFRALCECLGHFGKEAKHAVPYEFSPLVSDWTIDEIDGPIE